MSDTERELLEALREMCAWVAKLDTPWPSHIPAYQSLECDAALGKARDLIAKVEGR